ARAAATVVVAEAARGAAARAAGAAAAEPPPTRCAERTPEPARPDEALPRERRTRPERRCAAGASARMAGDAPADSRTEVSARRKRRGREWPGPGSSRWRPRRGRWW